MLDTPVFLRKLKEFEGVYPFMYLDTAGNVTVGVGHLLSNASEAKRLPFVMRSEAGIPERPATVDEIEADFDNVDNQTPGKLASHYKRFTKLDLPIPAIDSLLEIAVQTFADALRHHFPEFDSYPNVVCAALTDMAFNLGMGKLTSQFHNFCHAVQAKDWITAGRECQRNGIGAGRNLWTKEQFEKAGAESRAMLKAATAPISM